MIEKVADVLEAEGGWMRLSEIADRSGVPLQTVRRSAYRLRDRGCVETRIVDQHVTVMVSGGGEWSPLRDGEVEERTWVQPISEWRWR